MDGSPVEKETKVVSLCSNLSSKTLNDRNIMHGVAHQVSDWIATEYGLYYKNRMVLICTHFMCSHSFM